jgi:hypothetical protein
MILRVNERVREHNRRDIVRMRQGKLNCSVAACRATMKDKPREVELVARATTLEDGRELGASPVPAIFEILEQVCNTVGRWKKTVVD